MAKTKQSSNLHDTALLLCASMLPDKKEVGAQKTLASMRERNKETKEKLHGIFAQMQTAFERGTVIGGCNSMKMWCKAWKSQGALTYARVRQILTGKSGNEGKRSSNLTLKPGSLFTVDGITYQIPENIGKHSDHVAMVKTSRSSDMVHVTFWAKAIEGTFTPLHEEEEEEEPVSQPKPTETSSRNKRVHFLDEQGTLTCDQYTVPKPNQHTSNIEGEVTCKLCLSKIAAMQTPVTVPSKETLIAEGVRIIEKMDGQFTRTIWREESKIPERQIAKHWQRFNDFAQEVVTASFTDEPAKQVAIKLTKAQMREVDVVAVDKKVQPPVTLLINADDYEVQAEKLIWALHERREALDQDGRKLRNKHGDLLDWTNKEPKALEMKKKVRALSGSAMACEGAIRAFCYGSDDHHESLIKWYEDRIEEIYQTRIAELDAKQAELHPAAEAVKDTLETIAPEHKEVLKRHKAAAALGIDAGCNCPAQESEQ
jgi:hypothetical protein